MLPARQSFAQRAQRITVWFIVMKPSRKHWLTTDFVMLAEKDRE
jgi:hypothetical protein